jgi:hypothetical protein
MIADKKEAIIGEQMMEKYIVNLACAHCFRLVMQLTNLASYIQAII